MTKSIILNILVGLVLIIGIASIIIAIVRPIKLLELEKSKLYGRSYTIKDTKGFIKHNQKVYGVYGILCSIISILTLIKIVDYSIFAVSIGLIIAIVGLVNSISIKKYS